MPTFTVTCQLKIPTTQYASEERFYSYTGEIPDGTTPEEAAAMVARVQRLLRLEAQAQLASDIEKLSELHAGKRIDNKENVDVRSIYDAISKASGAPVYYTITFATSVGPIIEAGIERAKKSRADSNSTEE